MAVILTLTEAARITGIDRTTMRRAIDTGELAGMPPEPPAGGRPGEPWRVDQAELMAWLWRIRGYS